jgi:hypothetical protein
MASRPSFRSRTRHARSFACASNDWAADDGIVAVRGPVLIVNYRAAITHAVMQATEIAQREILSTQGGHCVMLSIVEGGLPLPDETGRASIVTHFRTVSSKNAAYATVMLGDGFWASAARSIMSTFTLVVKAPCPSLTSNEIAAGAKFMATHAPANNPVDAIQLASEINAMRRAAERAPVRPEL